ncbi:MAG: four-carbon acid sugar kinase family protein [Candidatus Brocadiia bacterium]
MSDLLVIADDLTGATETGAQFARIGLSVEVTVRRGGSIDAGGGPRVLVADTESRHLPPRQAGLRVLNAARRGVWTGVDRFYKKTDSTLRGNIGIELEALMRATGTRRLPFVPAYPQAGRTTSEGRHYVDGVPLAQTSFAADPLAPVRWSDIPEIIGRQTPVPVQVVDRGLLDAPELETDSPQCICVFDAQEPADLDRIASAVERWGMLDRCAGAAGFAQRVAERMFETGTAVEASSPRAPLLAVNGSLHERALAQVRCAMEAGMAALRLTPEAVFADDPSAAAAGTVGTASNALRDGRSVLLYTVSEAGGRRGYEEYAAGHGVTDPARAVARALGALARAVVGESPELHTLAAFGGETAITVLRVLGLDRLRPLRERWPSVVESSVVRDGREMIFITKGGGLGPTDLLLRLIEICGREGDAPCASE